MVNMSVHRWACLPFIWLIIGACQNGETSVGEDEAVLPSTLDQSVVDALPDMMERTTELCNNIDDDQDGEIDEGFNVGETCVVRVARCTIEGIIACDELGTTLCVTASERPRAERCNRIDDDCDGLVDEDYEVNLPCTNGIGACALLGSSICDDNGTDILCDADILDPTAELCNAIDDDCDGATDENYEIGARCEVGMGRCKQIGSTACDDIGGIICNATPLAPREEICDGNDDDCDGVVDEGACSRDIVNHCRPILLWRSGLAGETLPLDISTCDTLEDQDNFICVTPVTAGTFGHIVLPFSRTAMPFGYGFGIGITCAETLLENLRTVLTRDCRLYYGWHLSDAISQNIVPTLGACPDEFSGSDVTNTSWCSSSRVNGPLGGIEFGRGVAFGNGFGLAMQCRQTTENDADSTIRRLIKEELRIELAWTKLDAEFLSQGGQWPACEWQSASTDTTYSCASTQPDGQFGVFQIGRPASLGYPVGDVLGIRLHSIGAQP